MVNKKLQRLIWAGILFLLLFSLFRSVWLAHVAKNEVKKQQIQMENLQKEVLELQEKVENATSSYELERRVREELRLQKPDEVIIKLPE